MFSAGHGLSSITDIAAYAIWILHTNIFLFFFFFLSLWHLETSDVLFKFYKSINLHFTGILIVVILGVLSWCDFIFCRKETGKNRHCVKISRNLNS